MKMIKHEINKLLGIKFLWLLLIILLILNAILCYINTPADIENAVYIEEIVEQYKKNPESIDKYYADLKAFDAEEEQHFIEAMKSGIDYEPIYPTTYSGKQEFNDFMLLNTFYNSIISYKDLYTKKINASIQITENNKSEILGYYELDENSFAYKKQNNIGEHYKAVVSQTEFEIEYVKGWDAFFQYETVNLFIFAIILLGSSLIFVRERDGGIFIIRTTKRGRGSTAVAKLCVISLFSLLSVVLFLLSTFIAIGLKTGFSSITNSISAFSDFIYIPYSRSVFEFLLIFIGVKILVFIAFSLAISVLSVITYNTPVTFTTGFLAVAISFVVYTAIDDVLYKYVNLFGFASFTPITQRYNCFAMFGELVEYIPFGLILFSIIALIAFAMCVLVFIRKRAGQRANILSQILKRISSKLTKIKINRPKNKKYYVNIFHYEFFKTFLNAKFILIFLIIVAIKICMISLVLSPVGNYDSAVYLEYIEVLQGEVTEEKTEYIKAERQKIDGAISVKTEMKQLFRESKISNEDYKVYLDNLSYAEVHNYALQKIESHAEYITETAKTKNVSADFIYEIDWNRYINAGCDYSLVIFMVIIISGTFADEYKKSNGSDDMSKIIKTTRFGRIKTFNNKVKIAIIFSLCTTALFFIIDIIYINLNLYLPSGDSALLSIEQFFNTTTKISIYQYCVLISFIRFLTIIALTLIILFLSELLKNKAYVICIALLIMLIPQGAYLLGLNFMRYIDLTGALGGTNLYKLSTSLQFINDYGYLIVFMASLCALAVVSLFYTKKKFCLKI